MVKWSNSIPKYVLKRIDNTSSHTNKTCTQIFIAVLSITQKWKQSNVHHWGTDEQTVVYPRNGLFGATKRKAILTYAPIWINFENIMLSERSQTHKATCCLIPFVWHVRRGNSVDTESRLVGDWGCGGRGRGLRSASAFGFLAGSGEWKIAMMVGCTTKTEGTIYYERMNVMVCALHLKAVI